MVRLKSTKTRLKLGKPKIGLYPSTTCLVVTLSDIFKVNIMPVGLVGSPSLDPPTVGISVFDSHYTYHLLNKFKEFTLNTVTKNLVEKITYLGSISGRKKDKLKESKLTILSPLVIRTPILKECPVNMECKIIKKIKLGRYGYFIGEIVYSHITRGLLDSQGKIISQKLDPIVTLFFDYFAVENYLGSFKPR